MYKCDSPCRWRPVSLEMASLNPTLPGTEMACHWCLHQDVCIDDLSVLFFSLVYILVAAFHFRSQRTYAAVEQEHPGYIRGLFIRGVSFQMWTSWSWFPGSLVASTQFRTRWSTRWLRKTRMPISPARSAFLSLEPSGPSSPTESTSPFTVSSHWFCVCRRLTPKWCFSHVSCWQNLSWLYRGLYPSLDRPHIIGKWRKN